MKAKQFIEDSLAATLPTSVLPFYRRIISARFETKSNAKYRCAVGLLELFDGQQAGIEVWEHLPGCPAYQWLSLEHDLCYRDGQWIRVESEAA